MMHCPNAKGFRPTRLQTPDHVSLGGDDLTGTRISGEQCSDLNLGGRVAAPCGSDLPGITFVKPAKRSSTETDCQFPYRPG